MLAREQPSPSPCQCRACGTFKSSKRARCLVCKPEGSESANTDAPASLAACEGSETSSPPSVKRQKKTPPGSGKSRLGEEHPDDAKEALLHVIGQVGVTQRVREGIQEIRTRLHRLTLFCAP